MTPNETSSDQATGEGVGNDEATEHKEKKPEETQHNEAVIPLRKLLAEIANTANNARLHDDADSAQNTDRQAGSELPDNAEAELPEDAENAFEQIMEAIDDYRAQHLFEIQRERHYGPDSRTSDSRNDLKAILIKVKSLEEDIRKLPQHSHHLLARASRVGYGGLDHAISLLSDTAKRAVDLASRLPEQPADTARDVLAWDIARIMRDTLKRKPTGTRRDREVKNPRVTPLYSQLIEATFQLAGIKSFSERRVIGLALRMLNDPNNARGDVVAPSKSK